jgi:hypothetical protein
VMRACRSPMSLVREASAIHPLQSFGYLDRVAA